MESLLKKQADEIIHLDEWKGKLVINSIGVAGEMYLVDTPFVDSLNDCIQLWIDRRSGDVVCDDGYIAYNLLNITCSYDVSEKAVREYAAKHGIDFGKAGDDVLSVPVEFNNRMDIENKVQKLILAQLELEDRFIQKK